MKVRFNVTIKAGEVLDLPSQLAMELKRIGFATIIGVAPEECKEVRNGHRKTKKDTKNS